MDGKTKMAAMSLWFSGPSLPDNSFGQGEPENNNTEDDQLDLAAEFDDADAINAITELPWSDDSDSETEM